MHYFAYGTLLVENSMRAVCPSAKNVGYMRLEGYEMAFGNCAREGLAGCTLIKKDGAVTYGIQYELTDQDMAKMDAAAEVDTEQWVHMPITLIDKDGNEVKLVNICYSRRTIAMAADASICRANLCWVGNSQFPAKLQGSTCRKHGCSKSQLRPSYRF